MRRSGAARRMIVGLLSCGMAGAMLPLLAEAPAGAATASPEDVPALAGSAATGPRGPQIADDVLNGSLGLAVSTQPHLTWSTVPAGASQVRFTVLSLDSTNPTTVWDQTVSVSSGAASAVPLAGRLRQGTSYRWKAEVVTGSTAPDATRTFGPFLFQVDTQRTGEQPTFGFGGLTVAEGTGAAIVDWQSPALGSVAGSAGFSLQWQASNTSQPGLPSGWVLSPSGQSTQWHSLERHQDGTVTLVSRTGESVSFEEVAPGNFQPLFGAAQTWPQGAMTTLMKNPDGSYSTLDSNRVVTDFSIPNGSGTSWPTLAWSNSTAMLQSAFDAAGRLVAITDPASKRSIALRYAPDGCRSPVAGFVAAPDGQLCSATGWDASRVDLSYVSTPSGTQIGRITSSAGTGPLASPMDVGWDAAGRPSSLRSPLAAQAIAAQVVGGLTASSPEATTEITYDRTGRVERIVAPAGLVPGSTQTTAQRTRAERTLSYEPFGVKAPGVTTPTGFLERDDVSPRTLLPRSVIDAAGHQTTYEWDKSASAILKTTELQSGLVSETHYDASGHPIEEIGPTTQPTALSAPKTTIGYDVDYSKNTTTGTPYKGLATFYFRGASFTGEPAGSSIGPILGTSLPANLVFNWTTNPVGSGPYSIRLVGSYRAPSDGTYVFKRTGTPNLFMAAKRCDAECTFTLTKDQKVPMRIDLTSSGSTSGIKVEVTTPGALVPVPVPIDSLAPDLEFPTSETTSDLLSPSSSTSTGTSTMKEVYAPQSGEVVATIDDSGATLKTTYAPYDPSHDTYGAATQLTAPDGTRTALSAYGGTQAASAPCAGATSSIQGGLARSMSDPGVGSLTATQVYNAAGSLASSQNGPATTCATYDAAGSLTGLSTTSPGLSSVTASFSTQVGGNPLVSSDTTTTTDPISGNPVTLTTTTTRNLNGLEVQQTDAFGTVTTTRYDPQTDRVLEISDLTTAGHRSTTTYAYTPAGDLASMSLDAIVLTRYTYQSDGRLTKVTFSDGSTATLTYDANDNIKLLQYGLVGGIVAGESDSYSPAGRVLSRAVTGPDGRAQYDYTYDKNGRLAGATVSSTIPVPTNRWTYDYGDPATSTGNRLASTASGLSGVQHSTATYDASHQLTSLTGPTGTTSVGSNALGGVTDLLGTTLSYDATGQVTKVASPDTSVSLLRDAGGVVAQRVDTPTVKATWRSSGADLILGPDNSYAGRMVTLAPGTTAMVSASGVVSFRFGDLLGNAAWSSAGGVASRTTQLYEPFGSPLNATPISHPKVASPSIATRPAGPTGAGSTKEPPAAVSTTTLPTTAGTTTSTSTEPTTSTTSTAPSSATATTPPPTAPTTDAATPTTTPKPASEPRPVAGPRVAGVVTDPAQAAFGEVGFTGGLTLPTALPLVLMGSRTYAPTLGRWLQVDPELASINPYEFVDSNPITGLDPNGNSGWKMFASMAASILLSMAAMALTTMTAGAGAPLAAVMLVSAATGAVAEVTAHVVVEASFEGIDALTWDGVGEAAKMGALFGASSGKSAFTKAAKAAKAAREAAEASSRMQASLLVKGIESSGQAISRSASVVVRGATQLIEQSVPRARALSVGAQSTVALSGSSSRALSARLSARSSGVLADFARLSGL